MPQAAPSVRTEGPITRGMRQGALRHLEQPSATGRIPATRSNPAFELGRKLHEQQESLRSFVINIKPYNNLPFAMRVRAAINEATLFRKIAQQTWAQKDKVSEHQFYFNDLLAAFYFHSQFSASQLRIIRGFYEKVLSHPDVFSLDMAFADALSGCLGIGFVGDGYLAEKMVSLAKAAPEGKRFLTDFVVVRSLLNLERYDLVQELMNFRQVQESWMQGAQWVHKGETARVYEEVKLYKQTIQNIPVTFPEQLPARNKLADSPEFDEVIPLMERRSHAMLFQNYTLRAGDKVEPENSAEGLNWFLRYKHRRFGN